VETWTVNDGHCAKRFDAPLNVKSICEDANGQLWLGASIWFQSRPLLAPSPDVWPQPGLFRFDDDGFYRLAEADGFSQTEQASSVGTLCPDGNGGLWIGTTGEGLLRYRDGKCERHPGAGRAKHYYDVHQGRSQQLWLSTWLTGFYRLSGGEHRVQVGPEKFPIGNLPVRCITEDRDGNLWLGHANRGLRCISNPELTTFSLGISGSAVKCVLEDTAGDLWFGSGSSNIRTGLHRLSGGTIEFIGADDGLPRRVTCLAEAPDGRLWIGTLNGLACRDPDGTLKAFTTADGLGRDWIRSVYVDDAGVVWIGFWEGNLQRMEQDKFLTVTEFGNADVNWFHEDVGGEFWIGSNRGLYRWRKDQPERVVNRVLDELATTDFLSCFEDDAAQLWLGTDGGGLCRYADGRFANWNSAQGLHEDVIRVITEDARGRIWLGGAHGLTSLPMSSFDAITAGTIDRLDVRVHQAKGRFGDYQGPKVVRRRDDSIWFIMSTGAVVVPSGGPYQHVVPPQVHIEKVDVNQQSLALSEEIEIQSGSRRIEFHYTANTFAAPELARFRYRLVGFDNGWIDAGTQRSASYTDVPPGEYVFQVTADNGHGVGSEQPTVMALTVTPRWWEIGWLRVSVLLAGILAIIGYFRHRISAMRHSNIVLRREITERKRAEEESREHLDQLARVSRAASMGELTTSIAHEVKQPLFAIVSNAQTAMRLLDDDQPDLPEAREALGDIAKAGNQAAEIIDHIRSLVRKEHTVKDQVYLNEVVGDAVKLVLPELRKRSLTVRTELAKALPAIHGDPVELQQVILNLIINGAQSMNENKTESHELLVTTSADNGSVELAVTDFGVGLDETQAKRIFEPFFTTKPDGTGMGLAINRTIIEAHSGKIWAKPNAERGATFCFRLPISTSNGK
jgi:signal transduction histidine kinase